MMVGDKVEFITNGKSIPKFYTDHANNISSELIIHGNTVLAKDYDAKVEGFYNRYVLVSYTSALNKRTQLGFKKESLKFIKINWRKRLKC